MWPWLLDFEIQFLDHIWKHHIKSSNLSSLDLNFNFILILFHLSLL